MWTADNRMGVAELKVAELKYDGCLCAKNVGNDQVNNETRNLGGGAVVCLGNGIQRDKKLHTMIMVMNSRDSDKSTLWF